MGQVVTGEFVAERAEGSSSGSGVLDGRVGGVGVEPGAHQLLELFPVAVDVAADRSQGMRMVFGMLSLWGGSPVSISYVTAPSE